jgi:hypothetical protein
LSELKLSNTCGAMLSHSDDPTQPNSWGLCDAQHFRVRGPNYKTDKKKVAPEPAFYDFVGCATAKFDTAMPNVSANRRGVDFKPPGGAVDGPLPSMLVLNMQMPLFPPSLSSKNEPQGPFAHVLCYFRVTPAAQQKANEGNDSAIQLLLQFFEQARQLAPKRVLPKKRMKVRGLHRAPSPLAVSDVCHLPGAVDYDLPEHARAWDDPVRAKLQLQAGVGRGDGVRSLRRRVQLAVAARRTAQSAHSSSVPLPLIAAHHNETNHAQVWHACGCQRGARNQSVAHWRSLALPPCPPALSPSLLPYSLSLSLYISLSLSLSRYIYLLISE